MALVLGLAAAAQLATVVGAGIILDKAPAGTWVLFMSLVATLSAIGLCGTANAWAAALSRPGCDRIDWRESLARRARIGLPLTLAGVVIATLWFDLPALVGASLLIAVLAFQVKELCSVGLLRARRRYVRAAILQKLWLFVLVGIFGAGWLIGTVPLELLVAGAAGALLVDAILAWRVARRLAPPGRRSAPRALDSMALGYWAITLSLLATRHADRLILTSVSGREATATYGMMLAILGGFELGTVALGHVLLPHCNGRRNVPLGRLLLAVCGLATCLALTYLFAGPWVVDLVFKGKYAAGVPLLPLLVLVGVVRMVGVVPGSLIGARLGPASLRVFSRTNGLLAVVTVGLMVLWVPSQGMWGSGRALLVGEGLRTLVGLLIVWHWRDRLRSSAAGDLASTPST